MEKMLFEVFENDNMVAMFARIGDAELFALSWAVKNTGVMEIKSAADGFSYGKISTLERAL